MEGQIMRKGLALTLIFILACGIASYAGAKTTFRLAHVYNPDRLDDTRGAPPTTRNQNRCRGHPPQSFPFGRPYSERQMDHLTFPPHDYGVLWRTGQSPAVSRKTESPVTRMGPADSLAGTLSKNGS